MTSADVVTFDRSPELIPCTTLSRMAMGIREGEQSPLWVVTADLPKSPGHPFYARLNALLDANDFDRFVEKKCQGFYAAVMGRPSLTPGRYFRLLLLGYFEGIDSERGFGWRAPASLAIRSFLCLAVHAAPPKKLRIANESVARHAMPRSESIPSK